MHRRKNWIWRCHRNGYLPLTNPAKPNKNNSSNSNQTAALRIGAVRRGRAYVACSVDHRAVDGADVGRFLAAFTAALEPDRAPEALHAG